MVTITANVNDMDNKWNFRQLLSKMADEIGFDAIMHASVSKNGENPFY